VSDAPRTYLSELGVDEAWLDSVPVDDWFLVLQEHQFFGGPATMTAAEVASECDVDVAIVRRMWEVLGFGDPGDARMFRDVDLPIFRMYRDGIAFFGPAPIEHFARTLAATARRLTDATSAIFLESLGERREGSSLLEQLQLAATGGDLLVRMPDELLRPILYRSALDSQQFNRVAGDGTAPVLQLSVGFCDLVGSTSMLTSLPADVAGRAVLEFEAAATDITQRHGGRLIKLIGDEVLYVSVDPRASEAVAGDLVAWVGTHDVLSGARAGIARGDVFVRGGDVYGPTVNLAARLVGVAPPGAVVIADDGGDELVDVRGFDRPIRVRTVTVG
jgi:adenylate cyclase